MKTLRLNPPLTPRVREALAASRFKPDQSEADAGDGGRPHAETSSAEARMVIEEVATWLDEMSRAHRSGGARLRVTAVRVALRVTAKVLRVEARRAVPDRGESS